MEIKKIIPLVPMMVSWKDSDGIEYNDIINVDYVGRRVFYNGGCGKQTFAETIFKVLDAQRKPSVTPSIPKNDDRSPENFQAPN